MLFNNEDNTIYKDVKQIKTASVRIIDWNKVKKERYLLTQYNNIHIFNKIIFFEYRTRQIKATETNK